MGMNESVESQLCCNCYGTISTMDVREAMLYRKNIAAQLNKDQAYLDKKINIKDKADTIVVGKGENKRTKTKYTISVWYANGAVIPKEFNMRKEYLENYNKEED